MRRFTLPLALSLVAHGGLLGLAWYLPTLVGRAVGSRGSGSGRTLPLSITMVSAERPSPSRGKPPEKDWLDVEPVLVHPPSKPAAQAKDVPAATASAPGGTESGGPGSTPAPGVGLPGSPGPSGPPGSDVLPVAPSIQRVVFVLDRSTSMGQCGALGRACRELALSLRALPDGTQFQVFAYNHAITPLVLAPSGLTRADSATVALATDALGTLGASGGTAHVAALKRGLMLRPEVLFWLTDADELLDADVAAIRHCNQAGTTIHVVELSRLSVTSGDGAMARLATSTGGTYRRVNPER